MQIHMVYDLTVQSKKGFSKNAKETINWREFFVSELFLVV